MEHDPEARATLERLGLKALPVTVVRGQAIVGFNPRALSAALGLPSSGTEPLSAAELLPKYRHVFAGAQRAVLQIPDDRLDWVSPERARTLRQLTWHLFERPDLCLQAGRTGQYTAAMVRQYEQLALAYRTSQAIAAYGDEVLDRLASFLTDTPQALGREVDTYFGPATIGQLLELALGHAVHHLRQLYHYFTLLGIMADRPLGEADFTGIPVPTELF